MQKFTSEEQARQKAQEDALTLLKDKALLNPDKFDKVLLQHKRKTEQLESQIAYNIKNQIENVDSTRNFIADCQKNLQQCEDEVIKLNDVFVKDSAFHLECVQFEKLSIYRKNISVMLDQLKYFFNVKQQIEKMESLFAQGPEHYETISYKLLTLTDIRDNVVENIKNDVKASSQEIQIIIKEFQILSDFEEKFYSTIFQQFEMTLLLSIKYPVLLITLLRIVEAGDRVLQGKGKEPIFKIRAIESIKKGINRKFDDKLKDQKEAIMVLENSKFTASDLILVLDHTVKCFPKHYNIFDIFESQYRENIEKRVIPFLEDEEQVKQSYGTLISLLNWVDSYEALLSRVGLTDDSYVFLRSKVKYYMPFFMEHIQTLIVDYGEKAIIKDKEEQQTMANIERIIKKKQDLITYFPEDIFHFINQQVDILGPKLKGELLIEFFRSICQSLREIQIKETKNLLQNVPLAEDGQSLSPIYLVVLYVNNFYKCMQHSNETKQYSLTFLPDDQPLQERIENIFSSDLTKSFNESIHSFLEHIVKIIYHDISLKLIPSLFLPKWINEDIMNSIIETINDYLGDVQLLIVNQIYFNKLCKMVFSHLVKAYFEQLIMTVQFVQPTMSKNFFPKHLTDLSLLSQDKKKKDKKELKAALTNILQNRELILPQIEHDYEVIMKAIDEKYGQSIGKPTLDMISKRFMILQQSLKKSKIEIEGMLPQLLSTFENNAIYILEVALWIREDCDAQFKQQRVDQINQLALKQQQNS